MSTLKEINRLAIPAILYNIVEPLIGMADTAIIGTLPEHATEAQGGVGLAAGLFSLLVWSLAQVRTAVSAIISQYVGRDSIEDVRVIVPHALAISFLLGVLFWAGTAFFYEEIAVFLYNKSDQLTLGASNEYYQIRSIGLPLALLLAGLFGIFRGLQNTLWAMQISLVGGATNLLLDLILVNGVEGIIPAFGVAGAAYASLTAQAIMVLWAIIILYRKTPFNLHFQWVKHPELPRLISLTVNMMIRTVALNVTFILANRFANTLNKETLAAYTIGVNIWLFSAFFIDGYSNAGNALGGKLIGAKDYQGLNKMAWRLSKINVGTGVILALAYLIAYPFIGSLFSDDPKVVAVFDSFFWIVIIAQPLNAIAFTFDGIFKGFGEARFLRDVLLISTFVGFVPIIYLLDAFDWGIFAIWTAFVVWMFGRSASLVIRYWRKYRPLGLP